MGTLYLSQLSPMDVCNPVTVESNTGNPEVELFYGSGLDNPFPNWSLTTFWQYDNCTEFLFQL